MPTFPRSSLSLAFVIALGGCDIFDPIITTGFTSETGPSETSTVTTEDPSTSETTTDDPVATVTTDDPDPSGAVFILPPDPPAQCDVWAQDCPAGEKCGAEGPPPYSSGSIACAPIVPAPAQLGEPCQVLVEGHLGPDTCDIGLYCYDVDPVTQHGTCRSLCTGDINDPTCPSGQVCLNAALPMCLDACDPRLDTCPGDAGCLSLYPEFGCWAGSGQTQGLFEACEYADACQSGLTCFSSESASECDPNGIGCCTPYCDVDLPDTCPGVGQQCMPFYGPGEAPAGLQDLGVCLLP
ncbi:hypothetical protein OV203_15745 [Nannocystis sp. ILAH1]|uniref:hypothetical protein n=1 Tax=Nannocystis sp. ILAH1 TaxID=2996789 RepID=UPI00227192DC|nr:hypothetical protein [Nannocystis sp. ILAH1]MCY0988586.1 hypothetical protein [Nannocystis sp. ILAH1]